jgi:hypothetical protein
MSKITLAAWLTTCLIAWSAPPSPAAGDAGSAERGGAANGKIENSVVKIFATVRWAW